MTIVKWDPFRNVTALQDRINRLFDDAFPRAPEDDDLVCAWRPLVDIFENSDGIVIHVDLPGVAKQDVSVEIKDNVLTISGERQGLPDTSQDRYYRRERQCGTFQRSFTLRSAVAPDRIKASFKDGVLKVDIPKPEEDRPRQVNINVE